MSEPVLAVIPARLRSSRLPRKPLHPLLGRPLIAWVCERVAPMRLFGRVVVAVDSSEVMEVCRQLGAEAVMTDPDHPSGTDRVSEVAGLPPYRDFPVIVNVQGDEPLVREAHLATAVELVRSGGFEVGTLASPLGTREARLDPSVVKAARSADGRALYFSRAAIPHRRDGDPTEEELRAAPFLRHLGVYVYRRGALLRWVSLPPSPLERLERLEQLRALEAGIPIGVAVVEDAAPGVDTVADVVRMEEVLTRRGYRSTPTHGS